MSRFRRYLALAAVSTVALTLAACSNNDGAKSTAADSRVAAQQLGEFQKNQPVPVFNVSQLRQNLIEIETAQARTTQTAAFFFNQGVQDPVATCPSIGFPIPATYQLTNPQQKIGGVHGNLTLPQIEATGVYTADTSGTYVICIDAQGRTYAQYWEGFVDTVTGPAKWNTTTHQVELTGPPSFNFSKGK